MLDLLPAEYWRYKTTDIFRGLIAALSMHTPLEYLNIENFDNCIPIRSARAAIVIALKALDLPPGAQIGAPLYCCPVVFKAIKTAGFKVCFIDIEADTLCMSPGDLATKISQLDAVIVAHMFGHLCDMPKLREAAQDKPIIEDCAQSLGSSLNGQMAGSFGDIAVFSFRSGKYLSVGEGSALFSNNVRLNARLLQLVSELSVPGIVEECIHVIKTYVRSLLRSKPWWGLIGQRLWSVYNKSTNAADKTPIVISRMFNSDIAITKNRLPSLSSHIKKQRAYSDFYSKSLELTSCSAYNEATDAFYNRYLYPVLLPAADSRNLVSAFMLKHKISTIQPYKEIADIAAEQYNYYGDCPVAEDTANRILVLPNYHSLTELEVKKIVFCFNKALQVAINSSVN